MIRVACTNCGALLKSPEEKLGHRVKCPKCLETVQLPPPSAGIIDDENEGATPPASSTSRRIPAQSDVTVKCPHCGKSLHLDGIKPGEGALCTFSSGLSSSRLRWLRRNTRWRAM